MIAEAKLKIDVVNGLPEIRRKYAGASSEEIEQVAAEVLKKLIKERSNLAYGNDAEMVFKRRRDWDKVVKRRASIEKARKILGYEPKVDIRTGLERTYGWVLENKERIEQVAKF